MACSLSNLVDNHSGGFHEIKCGKCNKCCLGHRNFKNGLIELKCLYCIKIIKKKKKDENLKKKFANSYKFPYQDIKNLLCYCKNVFIYMNTDMISKKLMRHHYLKKKHICRHLNVEDITDIDYEHAKKSLADVLKFF